MGNWGDFTLLIGAHNSTYKWVVSPTLPYHLVAMTIVAPSVTWCNHFVDLLCLAIFSGKRGVEVWGSLKGCYEKPIPSMGLAYLPTFPMFTKKLLVEVIEDHWSIMVNDLINILIGTVLVWFPYRKELSSNIARLHRATRHIKSNHSPGEVMWNHVRKWGPVNLKNTWMAVENWV